MHRVTCLVLSKGCHRQPSQNLSEPPPRMLVPLSLWENIDNTFTRFQMSQALCNASLPPSRRELLRLMQKINFGRIEGLIVHDGNPVLIPPPAVIRELKFGGENGPRPE